MDEKAQAVEALQEELMVRFGLVLGKCIFTVVPLFPATEAREGQLVSADSRDSTGWRM